MKHPDILTYSMKKGIKNKKKNSDRPTLLFSPDQYRKQTIFFSRPEQVHFVLEVKA